MPIKNRTSLLLSLIFFITYFPAQLIAAPKIDTWTTKNGANVYFVSTPALPIVDVRVIFDAGSSRDQTQFGLSHLTNALMDQGTGKWSADEIAENFDRIGARYSNGALRDMAWHSIRSLKDPSLLNNAVTTLAEIIQKPIFKQKDFERERKRTLIALKQQQESPSDIAEKEFYQQLYSQHPYASPQDGSLESVSALTVADLISFHQKYYVAKNSVISIVGDINKQQANQIVAQLMEALPEGEKPLAIPKVSAVNAEVTKKIEFPSSQTHIWVGQPAISRTDPDYFPLYLGNHILGGSGLISMISNEVREKNGLAYSAYSYFLPMREAGPFRMGLQTKNKQAQKAYEIMLKVLNEFIQNGPTEKQVIAAKSNITGGFPLRIDSNKKIVEYLGMIGFYQLPIDYLDKFNQRINDVTIEQIKQAFKARVNPEKLVSIWVGGQ